MTKCKLGPSFIQNQVLCLGFRNTVFSFGSKNKFSKYLTMMSTKVSYYKSEFD